VARRLLAASAADDPELGYQHAQEARRLAARVGIVRETAGIAAYRAGHWAEALAELRAARRLTGRTSYLPMMADSERALGRTDRALGVIAESARANLDRETEVELRIVESGIRRDQGLADAAVVVLQLPELRERRTKPWSARLFYAYADALLDAGRTDQAREWFARAAAADHDEQTDAAERFDDLDDFVLDDLAADDEDEFELTSGESDGNQPDDEAGLDGEPALDDDLADEDDESEPEDEIRLPDDLAAGDHEPDAGHAAHDLAHADAPARSDLAADDLADDDQPL
jgi:tetratricopeptide (TPR) repeat protein